VFALLIWAAYCDIRNFEIPNWIPISIMAAGLILHGMQGSLFLAGMGLIISSLLFLLWKLKAIGGGDLKLFLSLGVMFGPIAVTALFLCTVLIAGGYALFNSFINPKQSKIPMCPFVLCS